MSHLLTFVVFNILFHLVSILLFIFGKGITNYFYKHKNEGFKKSMRYFHISITLLFTLLILTALGFHPALVANGAMLIVVAYLFLFMSTYEQLREDVKIKLDQYLA